MMLLNTEQVINPEPYQVWEYYNQECSLVTSI